MAGLTVYCDELFSLYSNFKNNCHTSGLYTRKENPKWTQQATPVTLSKLYFYAFKIFRAISRVSVVKL